MIRRLEDPSEKSRIACEILKELPDWFGIPESCARYVEACAGLPFWADVEDGRYRGFIAMKRTGECAAEIHVMGVVPGHHRKGVGRRLFEALRNEAAAMGIRYLHVKTVHMGVYEEYDRTNRFYLAMGFEELECLPELWDAANPCQIYIMNIEYEGRNQHDQTHRYVQNQG